MPVLCIRSNIVLSEKQRRDLLQESSTSVARLLRSGSCQVMASYCHCDMLFAGTNDPAVFVEIQSIGVLDERMCGELCMAVYDIVNRYETVDMSRMYFHLPVVNSHCAWKFVNGRPVCAGSPPSQESTR